MDDWHKAKVSSRSEAAEGLFHLVLEVPASLGVGHTHPGQYVKLKVEGAGEGFFAIASAPGAGSRFELLIKQGSPLATALGLLTVGSSVQLSAPSGKGFPLEQMRGKNLLLFATGSGIGAIRSAIDRIRHDRSGFGEVTLFFGVRTPAAFAYEAELGNWERAGIRVIRTVSQPGGSGWQGLTGYVQAHLGEVKVDDAVAFLVGQKAMVQGVTEALLARGLSKVRIFLNF